MDFRKINSSVRVKYCSKDKCLQNAEYICQNCQKDFCFKCYKEHATMLDTKHHSITLYRNKRSHFPNKNETCSIHLDSIYQKYCEFCNIPICGRCKGHKRHKKLAILTAYESKQKQIFKIRSDTVYQCQVVLKELKGDVKHYREEKKHLESAMDVMSRRIKRFMDEVLSDNSYLKNVHRCLSQKERIQRHVNKIQFYEQVLERLIKRPVKFLQFVKKLRPPSVEDTPNLHLHSLLSMTPDINVEDLMNPLIKIKITEKGKRHIENKQLLKAIYPDDIYAYDTYVVAGVDHCYHISCVTPDKVWINDLNSLILADIKTGVTLKRLPIVLFNSGIFGVHSVNSECELIYLENHSTVKKYCNDMTTKTVLKLKKRRHPEWFLLCVYCSPSTDDLLIGKKRVKTFESKVARYNKQGKLTQTIQNDKDGQALFKFPRFITENNNGDVVVSNQIDESNGAVVVTDRSGRHRFSYTGHPPESKILPLGICTDAFSNILVCDISKYRVQMIEENGRFFRSLELESGGIPKPLLGLSYDFNTHRLWVGSPDKNEVYAIRYIHRLPHLTGMSLHSLIIFDKVYNNY